MSLFGNRILPEIHFKNSPTIQETAQNGNIGKVKNIVENIKK
jgi:hypothetical protein